MSNAPVTLYHLSDLHLLDATGQVSRGVDPIESLSAVIAHARSLPHWPPDLMLFTGDLVDHPNGWGYHHLKEILDPLPRPVMLLPGNHDDPRELEHIMGEGYLYHRTPFIQGNWVVVPLSTQQDMKTYGHLSEQELMRLDETLATHPDKFAVIALHHQPMAVRSTWIDKSRLDNAYDFFSVLDRHQNPRLVLHGHVHDANVNQRKGVSILSAPSTHVQFRPKSNRMIVAPTPPGLLVLRLLPNGEVERTVERATKIEI